MNDKEIFHLYSDGNHFPRAKKAGFGGYIKNNDTILIEYSEQIKDPSYNYNFELLGILRGLQIACSMNIKHIISNCDDKNTVEKINKHIISNDLSLIAHLPTQKQELYLKIFNLIDSFNTIQFNYIPRKENKHSDALSRKYSSLLEQNYLSQFYKSLDLSELVLSNQLNYNKSIFFSHPNLIRSAYKANPFIVAPIRNRKTRFLAKREAQNPYNYLFIESFNHNEHTVLKSFYYSEPNKKELIKETSIPTKENSINFPLNFLINTCSIVASKFNSKNLWISSNSIDLNNFLSHKKKVHYSYIPTLKVLYQTLNNFDKIFFNNLPFAHQYSSTHHILKKTKKDKLIHNINSVKSLISKIQECSSKDKNKYFGLLVRFHLKQYKKLLERDLTAIEKDYIIQETNTLLSKNGIPIVNKKTII